MDEVNGIINKCAEYKLNGIRRGTYEYEQVPDSS